MPALPRDGRFIEKVGVYDPMKAKDDPARIVLESEKIQAWLAKGAQPTDRVLRFLDAAGLAKRPARNNPQKAEPGEKAKERAAKRAEERRRARPRRRREPTRASRRAQGAGSPFATSPLRNSRRRILPTLVFGSSLRNSTNFGRL